MTNLKTAQLGQNKYCGPAVLSILTGRNSDDCANVISRISGNYQVTGVALPILLKAADKLGFDCFPVKTIEGSSLYSTLTRLVSVDGMYILWIGNHYVCIEVNGGKIFFCDNHTKEPIPAASSARLTMKVVTAYRVVKRPELEPPKPKLAPKVIDIYPEVIVSNEHDLFVDRIKVFEDEDGNVTTEKIEIGRIITQSNFELNVIIAKIKEMKYEWK